jgi:hypothetical protein
MVSPNASVVTLILVGEEKMCDCSSQEMRGFHSFQSRKRLDTASALEKEPADFAGADLGQEVSRVERIENPRENLDVGIRPADVALGELEVVRGPEVAEVVLFGLSCEVEVGDPVSLELVEEQLVGFGEVRAEPLFEERHDLG